MTGFFALLKRELFSMFVTPVAWVVLVSFSVIQGFHFLTLEDEWGMINVIVSPGLAVRDGTHLRGDRVLLVEGVVRREADVINVVAQRVGPLAVR